jgi:hypothetical protein
VTDMEPVASTGNQTSLRKERITKEKGIVLKRVENFSKKRDRERERETLAD